MTTIESPEATQPPCLAWQELLPESYKMNRFPIPPTVHSSFPPSLNPTTTHETSFPHSAAKILSHLDKLLIPPPTPASAQPLEVDLNFLPAFDSFRSSSLNTATITSQDFQVFTTDPQSTWLPSSSSSLPAPSAQQFQPVNPPQQDFVLFDQPPSRSLHNSSAQQASALNSNPRRHSSHSQSSSLQNHRVAQIIQATGHPTTSSAFTNRFSSASQNQNQFYASSAPTSSVALSQQNPVSRPPVPLFSQSTGSVPRTSGKMNIQDIDVEDFTGFEGGAPASAYSSPAMPPVFDMNASASSSTTNMGTVSPQDLLIQEPFMSAPNSTAFTALTSPSIYNESPEFNDNFDVSPSFGSGDFDNGSNDPWFPLFPQENFATDKSVDKSPAQGSDELEVVEFTSASSRRKSGNSPPSGPGRHASVSGVGSRRRDKPLPPIIVEDASDVVAMKRARNTLAARKSRERKAMRFEELEEKIAKLEEERDHWKEIALARSN